MWPVRSAAKQERRTAASPWLRQEQQQKDSGHAVRQLALVARALRPEIHQNDPDAVERVEEDCRDQPDLHQADERVLVQLDRTVVRLR